MKKTLLLFVLLSITAKSYSIIFWQPYPILATVASFGAYNRIECTVYDSLLGSWQQYNTPYYDCSIHIYANTGTIIAFDTHSSNDADSVYGFIAYDQELHQFMPVFKDKSDPGFAWVSFVTIDNVLGVEYQIYDPLGDHVDYREAYLYDIHSHRWSGGLIEMALSWEYETCDMTLYPGTLIKSEFVDGIHFDNSHSACSLYDLVLNNFTGASFDQDVAGNQDLLIGADWGASIDRQYFSCYDPALHYWKQFDVDGYFSVRLNNGIFYAYGGNYNYIGIYDDLLHQWVLDSDSTGSFYNPIIKDRIVAYKLNDKVFYQVFSPTSRSWVKDSSQTNGVDTLFIQDGTVNWIDTIGNSHVAGYIDSIGWGNFITPLQLNFHITDLYDSTGYPLIYVRDYSIGTDSTWYDFGDGVVTSPGSQHSLWHLYKSNGHYQASPTSYNVCIKANTAAGVQSSCGGKTLLCSSDVIVKQACANVCNGSADAIPLTGVSPFTYLWSTGNTTSQMDSLCAGNYTVTITDSTGCTVKNSFTITSMTITTSVLNNHCAGSCDGRATVNAFDGSAPYTYVWSTGDSTMEISNLCAGNYSVTVTDTNQCASTTSVNVAVINPLTLFSSTVYQGDCINSSDAYIEYNFSGGVRPFTATVNPNMWVDTFTVNNNFNVSLYTWGGLAPGIYTTVITDAYGCSITLTDTIIVTIPITAFSVSGVKPSCFGVCDGGFIPTIVGGNPPFQFYKCSGASVVSGTLCAGSYCVRVYDSHGCTTATTMVLINPPLLNCSAISQNPSCIGCSNGYIAINNSGGTPPYSLSWNPNNGFISGDTIYNLPAGVYSITVTDTNGCDKTIIKTLIDSTVAVFELSNDNAIVISPNPATHEFTIYLNGLPLNNSISRTIEIYNAIGEKMYIGFIKGNSQTVNCEHYGKGVYLIRLQSSHESLIRKLIIQ